MSSSEYADRSDGELEGMAASGDNGAFAELYERHFDRVYDFSLRLVRDADEAADVAQETFLKAMAALSPKKHTAAFTTWVLTIARNTALNRLRSRKTVAPSLDEAVQPEAVYREVDADRLGSPEEELQAKELAGLVWQAATALDPKQYSLLDLHLRQGLDSGEIAEVLGTTKNNAYVMMSRLKDGVEESITAFIMARRGRRECADLDDLLTGRGTVFFDADMRKVVARHIEACATCQEQRKKLVSPTTIFGALAAVAVPLGLKQKALAEAMGQWAILAGSEAGKAGGLLSRLVSPLRSPFAALRQAGWFAGWKGAALLVSSLLVVVGMGAGALILTEGLGEGRGDNEVASSSRTPAAAVALSSATPTPTAIPTPTPPTVLSEPVEAIGQFNCIVEQSPTGCWTGLTAGNNQLVLAFNRAGGPVSGHVNGEETTNSPSCTFAHAIGIEFSGDFNRATGELSGTATVTGGQTSVIRGAELEKCQSVASGAWAAREYPWKATLDTDGRTLVGEMWDPGSETSINGVSQGYSRWTLEALVQ